MVRGVEVMVSAVSGGDIDVVYIQFFLSGMVNLEILNLGVSVYCGWNFIIRKDYVAVYVSDYSSPA